MLLHFSMICSLEVMRGLSVKWKHYMVLCYHAPLHDSLLGDARSLGIGRGENIYTTAIGNATRHGLICCFVDVRRY